MAKRYPRGSRVYLLVLLAIGLAWVLLGCHPQFHLFGKYNDCPPCSQQADELERDPMWDALKEDDAPTDAD